MIEASTIMSRRVFARNDLPAAMVPSPLRPRWRLYVGASKEVPPCPQLSTSLELPVPPLHSR